MRLLEREHPSDVLSGRAEQAAAGRGSVVLVAGEAGIGKTALLRAFAAAAPVPVLWGMCDPLSTPRPLGPLRDVADGLGSEMTAALAGAVAQHEIFAIALDALRARPRALVVEDLHWGDGATLDLVRFLARRIASLPLLLVVSYRDAVDASRPLGAVLGDLVSAADARRLQLAPLSRGAVARLLEGHDLDPADVHRRTAGNPFFVSQIAEQPGSPLPESVRDAVLSRVAPLDPDARAALELLSCAPEGVGGELLAGLDVPAATVAALAATGLIERAGKGVAFRHEIARSAVQEAILPGFEAALHARMIDALEAAGGDVSVLAHHAAAVPDVPRILRYAPLAAAQAARSGAHRESVAFYELALRHAEAADVRAGLLEQVSRELYLTDRLDNAVEARTRALDLRAELADTAAVGAAHTAISGFAWYAADRAEAERHDEAALAILSGGNGHRALGHALANHAFLAAQRGDLAEARSAGEKALGIADEVGGDAVLQGFASIGLALVRLLEGDLGGRAELLAIRDLGLRHRDDDLATTPMSNLCHLDVEQGRYPEAEASIADALRVSRERDTPICSMWQLGVRARLRLLQGRWDEAEQDARAVLAAGEFPLGRLWPHLVLGLLAARREAPAENVHLDELWRLAQRLDSPGRYGTVAAVLAEQAWILRRPDPRLQDPRLAGLADAGLQRWAHRLTVAGVQRIEVSGDVAPVADPGPYERAMQLWDEGSTDALLDAFALLDELAARPVAAIVRARLRDLDVGSLPRGRSPATRANPAGLTDRQLDVLALLAEGKSNSEIAAHLVISPRTADHHVSAILAKLQVRSRGEAAALARRLGV
ncbi:MAG: AAA family ATPase [Pseudonocardia sp.]